MEKINDTLKRLAGNQDFKKRYEMQRAETLQNSGVQAFLQAHKEELTEEIVERSLIKLYEFSKLSIECNKCPSLDGCINFMKGYHPELVIDRGMIDIKYDKCPRKVMYDEKRKNEKLIQSLYVPRDILNATFDSIYEDAERIDAVNKALYYCMNYKESPNQKGLYLYGKFGVGKSYLLGAIANELANKKVSSMIVYVPELFRELKSSIGDATLNEKLEAIKRVSVLMFDDIGAETMSSWTRDEILGPILQFRMLENLPTFFTSNFDFKGLEHHLSYSQRGEEEKLKARRILERIKYLTEPVHVDGRNRRV
ncbi:primosomal protein DnaI [Cytobacillus purgationiresistens]|uniref:Primosomal protein DnaI n=1 Tax=Cytobacillus purgationiresistens TaxID=863449 RepID=A0ABU0AFP1_9BACI|nr:primosomal protein DnaI [Cytobacillus purgationiresistens]MDQ0270074.1 primosomal protein DnaI [Cytobacillus purgationiresistens]